MTEDWIQQLMRDYQDRVTRGAFDGICQLPEAALDTVMERQAHACVNAFVSLYDLPGHLDLEAFLARMTTGGPSKIHIQRDGDTILWQEQHEGQCMCPLVRRNVIPLRPALCVCAIHWLRMLVERHAHRPARVELVESVATGGRDCIFRVKLADPAAG